MAYSPWTAGMQITAGKLNSMVGIWQAYTPTWTSDGGTTTLGNGELIGRYQQVGDQVTVVMRLGWGSTTSSTGTAWHFSLPTPVGPGGSILYPLEAWIYDSSVPTRYAANGYVNATAQDVQAIIVHGSGSIIDQSDPMIWATGDRLNIWGTYESS